ncbi:hypothetical protein [Streptomyces luteolus]|uniref:Uncharacterized protein n=1 Tax=Streptomyces luteolus TaxID=3043615 RepID=A0ABT6SNU7_9ACTN|nr:hypothetical protein [Streptomyces sp. B-S-A12]MDI3417269.1 hypothetical protein [Streptomyces sp. B-S-A12]
MGFSFSDEQLEMYLSRARLLSAFTVPAYLALLFFFANEEGWRWSLLALLVLPPVAAVLGHIGKRDIRPGLATGAIVLSIAPLLVVGAIESL